MPFITIELSDNLEFAFKPFALEMHRYLAPRFNVPVDLFKTKLLLLPYVVVGEGDYGYARLKVELKAGRNRKMLIESLAEVLKRFKKALADQNPDLHFRITCEFSEIDPELLLPY